MKCNHCNSEVADGTNFCPNCGNRIETTQSLKCPQCNTEVADSVKFCPNCGSSVETPQPQKCNNCGTEFEEGEKFCSNCGTPVGSAQQPQMQRQQQSNSSNSHHRFSSSNSVLSVVWDGTRKKFTMNNPIYVYVNNQKCAEFSPKSTFERKFPILSDEFSLQLENGKGPFNKTDINLTLEPNQNYECTFFLNATGTFGYELKKGQNMIIKEDGNISMIMVLLFMSIPFSGFIFYFIKKDIQPLSAKMGLLFGFGNIVLMILSLLFS